MNNPILNILRLLALIPVCFIVIAIINWSLMHLFIWVLGLGKVWIVLIFLFLGGTIWGIFNFLASMLVMFTTYISPVKWVGAIVITVLSIVNGVLLILEIYEIFDSNSGMVAFLAFVAGVLVFQLTFALIMGAILGEMQREES
jgi:hypothetical protein